ncbi:TerC family protein [Kineococcus rubinsiae]|uniref:TerC family protein n=1 Tax=Kineococcus rubinsiae TaxID=2609562 RepID=UPI00143138F9|nr:TerC family protein [Kineococcus rubinsiae]NIZ90978.1 TerC family protein [Kineococcus rubinsiae]
MDVPLWAWFALGAIIVVMLAIDLLAHRGAHVIGFREAAKWSALWVGLALAFGVVIFATLGTQAGVDYTTAWLLEKSLSVDNLFVFALIFGYFNVPREFQHRVLFFGVLGALVFRGIFLGAGVAIVERFTAVLFVFGAILIWSAYKMLKDDDESVDPGKSLAVRLLRKVIPITDEYHGTKFFLKQAGKRVGTPLLAVVVAIEAADLVFAVDSVPAVLAVTSEPFIVYSSNAFAILGLRALYFLLSGLLERFHLLSKALAFILAFIGIKLFMQAGHEVISESIPHIPSWISLIVIVLALTWAIVFSLRKPAPAAEGSDHAEVTADETGSTTTGSSTTGSGTTGSTGTGPDTTTGSPSLVKDAEDERPSVSSTPDGPR